jgi:hypothetical protein
VGSLLGGSFGPGSRGASDVIPAHHRLPGGLLFDTAPPVRIRSVRFQLEPNGVYGVGHGQYRQNGIVLRSSSQMGVESHALEHVWSKFEREQQRNGGWDRCSPAWMGWGTQAPRPAAPPAAGGPGSAVSWRSVPHLVAEGGAGGLYSKRQLLILQVRTGRDTAPTAAAPP